VRPYAGAVGDGFILMDDNARPHRARVVTDYLENETSVKESEKLFSRQYAHHEPELLRDNVSACYE
jgi:hypothetical protein